MLLKNFTERWRDSQEFNQYFGHIADSPDLYDFSDENLCKGLDDNDNIVSKFRNHPSIVKIKEQYKVKRNFSFKLATTEDIKTMIWDLPTDKAAGVEIPVTFLLMN